MKPLIRHLGIDLIIIFTIGLSTQLLHAAKTESIKQTAEKAKNGDPQAQCQLASRYESGSGVKQSTANAILWYTKAAAQDYTEAQYQLGILFSEMASATKDSTQVAVWNKQAVMWFQAAAKKYQKEAEQGKRASQCTLGQMYELGQGLPQNNSSAVKWYRAAAEQGYPPAQLKLASMYLLGRGTAKDASQALAWYQKAAEQGLPIAQFIVGAMYETGEGTGKDMTQAFKWYQKTAEQNGPPLAQYKLGYMYESGEGTTKDPAKALDYYQKAAAQGLPQAQCKLGSIYYDNQNYLEAATWFRAAANQGDSTGIAFLAKLYQHGDGVDQDLTKALELWQTAAKKGEPAAQYVIGTYYAQGTLMAKNEIEGLAWLYVAKSHGEPIPQLDNQIRTLENKLGGKDTLLAQQRSTEIQKTLQAGKFPTPTHQPAESTAKSTVPDNAKDTFKGQNKAKNQNNHS